MHATQGSSKVVNFARKMSENLIGKERSAELCGKKPLCAKKAPRKQASEGQQFQVWIVGKAASVKKKSGSAEEACSDVDL
jgi:hypothetical protein